MNIKTYGSISITKVEDGRQYFTWIKYADDEYGTNISDSSDNKSYMGIAYNKTTEEESNNPNDYTWTLIRGANGNDGISVTSTTIQYCLSSSNSQEPETGWTDNFNDIWNVFSDNYYVWRREKTVYSDGNVVYSNPRVDSASRVVASWCTDADKTLINGGKIATNSITVNQLSANSVTTYQLTTDAIQSRNYVQNSQGSFLNLADGSFDSKNFRIDNSGNVTVDGKITASSGSIAGFDIGAGKSYSSYGNALSKRITGSDGLSYEVGLKAAGGETDLAFYVKQSSDNWASSSNVFYVNNQGKLRAKNVQIEGGTIEVGSKFKVTSAGVLSATDGDFTGKITATSGTIAGFDIGLGKSYSSYGNALSKRITSDDGKTSYEIGMKASGGETDLAFYVKSSTDNWTNSSNVFYVNNQGLMMATNGDFSGKITSSSGDIAGWKITNGKIYKPYNAKTDTRTAVMQAIDGDSNNVYVFAAGGKSDSSYADCPFRVSKTGTLYANDLRLPYGARISFTNSQTESDSSWVRGISFGELEVDSTKYTGFHFGYGSETTYLWGGSVKANNDIVLNQSKYLKCGSNNIIGVANNGHTDVYSTSKEQIRLFCGDVKVAGIGYVDTNPNKVPALYLAAETEQYIRAVTGGKDVHIVGATPSNNILLGDQNQPGDTNIYTNASKSINFYVGSSGTASNLKCYVNSNGLTVGNGNIVAAGNITTDSNIIAAGNIRLSTSGSQLNGTNSSGESQRLVTLGTLSNNYGSHFGHSNCATYFYGSAFSFNNDVTLDTINGFRVPEIQYGSVSITPSAANTPTSYILTFPKKFSGVPRMIVSAHTSAVEKVSVTTASSSTTGYEIWLTRTNTKETTVNWVAIY